MIKIYDNMLDVIKNSENTTWLAVTYGNQLVWQVKNGTELPKGHGRLIDADAVLEEPIGNTYKDIDIAETIIEADKESE